MITLYCARYVLPMIAPPVEDGAIAIQSSRIVGVDSRAALVEKFPEAAVQNFGEAAILPGFVNAHSHLELTAMRGFLEREERDFTAWLKKLTVARLEQMSPDDLYVSAAWGAVEAARAGVTYLGDASDAARESLRAIGDVGLRATVYQESFGPDPRLAREGFEKLRDKVAGLREFEIEGRVRLGVSPHAPYTVSAPQLELIAEFALAENFPVMMHAAESVTETLFMREGRGPFAEGLAKREIEWRAPGLSTVQYLDALGFLRTRPLLAHCIMVDEADLETIKNSRATIAHCPRSNAKLGHGRAPFASFIQNKIPTGLGSDSVASNNACDILEEARFATLLARSGSDYVVGADNWIGAQDALVAATLGGAHSLSFETQTGALAENLAADFVVVGLNGAHQQPVHDVSAALVFASTGRDVVLTVVAGREVYREGRVQTIDENRLRERLKEVEVKLQRVK